MEDTGQIMQKEYIIAIIGAVATIIAAFIAISPNLKSSGIEQPIIPEGIYRQTFVKPNDLGECPQCEITISYRNKNTIHIESNNGWFGDAIYDKRIGAYTGTSEYLKGKGGSYKDIVSNIKVFYDNNVISLDSTNDKVEEIIQITYRKKINDV